MHALSRKTLVASAVLGALVAGPTAYFFSGGSVAGGCVALLGGAGTLALVRRAAGARLLLLGILSAIAVMVGGPVLLTAAVALSPGGTGNAGFLGLLFVFTIAGQLAAVPLGIVTGLVHVVVARATR